MLLYWLIMQKSFGREVAGVFIKVVAVLLTFVLVLAIADSWYSQDNLSDGTCNIAVFPLEGVIIPFDTYEGFPLVTTPKDVRSFIRQAEDDVYIKGILFEINSPGGTPVASEQIADMIKETSLSTVSLIGDVGVSGAYMAAVASDWVVASAMSGVGSIGVTMSYIENSKKNEEEGITFVQLSSGEFKDAGNPDRPLSEEERKLFERDLELVHKEFVKKVAEMRGKSVEEIEAVADGSSVLGVRALEAGLIDAVGGRSVAKEKFAEMLNLSQEDVVFCEYKGDSLLF